MLTVLKQVPFFCLSFYVQKMRSLVMDEKKMRPGYWLGVSALTLLIGWLEGHPVNGKPVPIIPGRFTSRTKMRVTVASGK